MDKGALNDKLAAAVDAIYEKWFVEFQSPFSTPSIDGELPHGWRYAEIGDYLTSYSKTHSFNKERLIFLNTSDILAGDFLCDTYRDIHGLPGQAKKSIKEGDILFSEIRPANKRYALVTFNADDYVVSTKLMVLRTIQDDLSNLRFYHLLTREQTLLELNAEADGKSGTFPQITFDGNLKYRTFVVADIKTEEAFQRVLESYFEMVRLIQSEVKTLLKLKAILSTQLGR